MPIRLSIAPESIAQPESVHVTSEEKRFAQIDVCQLFGSVGDAGAKQQNVFIEWKLIRF
jgi:hypothetical protein